MPVNKSEQYLQRLFDLQRFDPDDQLQQVIVQSMKRLQESGKNQLDDDALDIYAAGDPNSMRESGDRDDD